MAEEVANLDNISRGRLDLGIGRSGFPWAYDGYDIPYSESRARFREYFDVMKLAWIEAKSPTSPTYRFSKSPSFLSRWKIL